MFFMVERKIRRGYPAFIQKEMPFDVRDHAPGRVRRLRPEIVHGGLLRQAGSNGPCVAVSRGNKAQTPPGTPQQIADHILKNPHVARSAIQALTLSDPNKHALLKMMQ
jgi:hypothetical protein